MSVDALPLPAFWLPAEASVPTQARAGFALGEGWPDIDTARPAPDPWAALRAAHQQAPERDVLLLRSDRRLPAGFWARVGRAWANSDTVDVLSGLNGRDLIPPANVDGLAMDAVCWQRGEHAVIDCAYVTVHGSVWRAAALARLFSGPDPERMLPTLRKALLPCLWLGDCDDARFATCPDWLLQPILEHLGSVNTTTAAVALGDGRPVVLHVLHAWGGGIECFARDLQAGDLERHHLFLLSQHDHYEPPFGRRMALFADLDAPALRTWELAAAIDDTAVASPEMARLLATVIADWGVGAVLVSSLIGHSLDVLRTGLPTAVCAHDVYPIWPLLHDPRDPHQEPFDSATLSARLGDPDGKVLFNNRDAAHWQQLREAYETTLHEHRVTMVTPSAFARDRLCAIDPALATLDWLQISHGAPALPRIKARAPGVKPSPLRVLVPGHIPDGKGERLLRELLPMLDDGFDVFLLGAGPAGLAFRSLPFVRFQEHYRREALADAVAQFEPDVALLPSTVPETWGYVLTEMLQLGVPVLASNLGAYAERLKPGHGGWLMAADAAAALSMLQALRDQRARLNEAGITPGESFLSLADMAAAWRIALPAQPFSPRLVAADAGRIEALVGRARWQLQLEFQSAETLRVHEHNRQLDVVVNDEREQRHLLECDLAIKQDKLELADQEIQSLQSENARLESEAVTQLQALAITEDELARRQRDVLALGEDLAALAAQEKAALTDLIAERDNNLQLQAALALIQTQSAEFVKTASVALAIEREKNLEKDLALAALGDQAAQTERNLLAEIASEREKRMRLDEALSLLEKQSAAFQNDATARLASEKEVGHQLRAELMLLNERASTLAHYSGTLRKQVAALESSQSTLNDELRQARRTAADLTFRLTTLKSENAGLVAELVTEREQIVALTHEQDGLVQTLTRLDTSAEADQATIANLNTTAAVLRDELLATRAQLDDLYQSTSWRATAGLRALKLGWLAARAHSHYRIDRIYQWLRRANHSLRTRGLRQSLQHLRDRQRATMTIASPTQSPSVHNEAPASIVFCEIDTPAASIIIPVYNQIAMTLDCLASIAAHGAACSFEVIVVDDASSAESTEPLSQVTGLRLHRNAQNLGFIGACNAGAALARGEFLVFLNNDTVVQANWLDALLATFETHPDTGLAGSKLVYPDGRLQEAGGIVFSDGSGWNFGRFDDPAHPAYNFVREVDYCSGAAIALRTTLFREINGFDSHYAPAYYEDTDLAMRVRQQGLKVRYQPASVVVHLEGATSGTDVGQGVKAYQVVNQQKFLARWQSVLEREHPAPGTDIAIASSHRARKRLLVIDACTPMPDRDSGSVRLFELLRLALDDGHALSFFPDNRMHDGAYTQALQQIGVQAWWHPWLADVPTWLKEHGPRFDAIIVSRHYILTPLLPLLRQYAPQARIVFDTVDLHFLREQREAEQRDDAAARRAALRTRDAELALIGSVDETWVVSRIERDLLTELAPGAGVTVLSNILRPRGLGPGHGPRADLVFVGGYRHTPNVDAALWLASEIFPLIRAQRPEIRLHLVGSDTPDRVRELASQPGIEVHGHVPDLAPLLDRMRINLAPLRYGAGVKGKINHSLAHGLPVVATSCAAEGMQLTHLVDVMIADSAQAFADAVLELYDDGPLWQELADAGLENTRQHFSPEQARPTLRRLLRM